jgi:hypothetical protein
MRESDAFENGRVAQTDISFIWMKLGCGNGPLDRTLVSLIIFWCQLATSFNRLLQIDWVEWQIENILAFLQPYK